MLNNNMLYISNNITLQYNLILSISSLTYILSLLLLPLMIINTHVQCSSLLLQNNNANTQKDKIHHIGNNNHTTTPNPITKSIYFPIR